MRDKKKTCYIKTKLAVECSLSETRKEPSRPVGTLRRVIITEDKAANAARFVAFAHVALAIEKKIMEKWAQRGRHPVGGILW